jgi:hypothetical protein
MDCHMDESISDIASRILFLEIWSCIEDIDD